MAHNIIAVVESGRSEPRSSWYETSPSSEEAESLTYPILLHVRHVSVQLKGLATADKKSKCMPTS